MTLAKRAVSKVQGMHTTVGTTVGTEYGREVCYDIVEGPYFTLYLHCRSRKMFVHHVLLPTTVGATLFVSIVVNMGTNIGDLDNSGTRSQFGLPLATSSNFNGVISHYR